MMSDLPPEIFNRWMNTKEDRENDKDVLIFKLADNDFLATRGRKSIDIQKNGNIIFYQLGQDDRPTKKVGYFKPEGNDRIRVYSKDEQLKSFVIQILSLKDNVLRIKILRDT